MVVSMWGLCDRTPIIFEKIEAGIWTCRVPADYSDGTYIVEVWAESNTGYVIYRTAILYMCDSRFVGLDWIDDGIRVSIKAVEHRVKPLCDSVRVRHIPQIIRALPDEIKIKVVVI